MSSVHDNGRIGQLSQPDAPDDLEPLIDAAGALVAGLLSLAHCAASSAVDHDGVDIIVATTMLSVASDLREAGFYVRRALVDLRGLL